MARHEITEFGKGKRGVSALDRQYEELVRRGTLNTPKSNYEATTDPGVDDDVSFGYEAGSLWLNTTDNGLFYCSDASAGAAAWTELSTGGGSHTVASHSDTGATGAELETLTDGSDADALHDHAGHGVTHNAVHGISKHTAHGNRKVLYTDGSGDEQELALGADATVFASAGAAAVPVMEEIYVSKTLVFSSEDDSPSVNDIVDGFPNGIPVGESGEHGDFTAIRAKATVDDANKGTDTNTVIIEADDNPAFSSPTTLFTLAINALGEVDDTGLDNTWAAGDIFIRAKWSAVATPPKRLRAVFCYKERAENF